MIINTNRLIALIKNDAIEKRAEAMAKIHQDIPPKCDWRLVHAEVANYWRARAVKEMWPS